MQDWTEPGGGGNEKSSHVQLVTAGMELTKAHHVVYYLY